MPLSDSHREHWLGCVQVRLDRTKQDNEWAPVLEPGALTEANQLAATLQLPFDNVDLLALHRLGSFHWYRFHAVSPGDEAELRTAISYFAPCLVHGRDPIPDVLRPQLGKAVELYASDLLAKAMNSADRALHDAAVEAWRAIRMLTDPDGSDSSVVLTNLAAALNARRANLDDEVEAVALFRTVLDRRGGANPEALRNLAAALFSLYKRSGAVRDLEEAVVVFRRATAAIPAAPGDGLWPQFGKALVERFHHHRDVVDLDEAIALFRNAAAVNPPDSAVGVGQLLNLGFALRDRYEHRHELIDLDAAIDMLRVANAYAPADQPDPGAAHYNIGLYLHERYRSTCKVSDLDAAIEAFRTGSALTQSGHSRRHDRFAALSSALADRHRSSQKREDLDAAVVALREASTAASGLDRIRSVEQVGLLLANNFCQSGERRDLDDALTAFSEAHGLAPDDPAITSRLGLAFKDRYFAAGQFDDLMSAVEHQRSAVACAPAAYTELGWLLTNLAATLHERYRHTWDSADLDESIRLSRDAVAATPLEHQYRAEPQSNLGCALADRYERSRDTADLLEAVVWIRGALQATDDPDRPNRLDNLAKALLHSYERFDSVADLDEAVQAWRESVANTSIGSRHLCGRLSSLGAALVLRTKLFDLDKARARPEVVADVNEAVEVTREAVRRSTKADHSRAQLLMNLAYACVMRFTMWGSDQDRLAALIALLEASGIPEAPASDRVKSAIAAAGLLRDRADDRVAQHVLEVAVGLLGDCAPRKLDRSDRQYALAHFAGLASEAAAAALTVAESEVDVARKAELQARAVAMLEQGRAVLVSEALETRSDLSDLAVRAPDLATNFVRLRDLLDAGGWSGTTKSPHNDAKDQRPARTVDRHRLLEQFGAVVAQIRSTPELGLTDFLMPQSRTALTSQAALGPVVVVNVAARRSDAFLITTCGVEVVALPNLRRDAVAEQVNRFHNALVMCGDTALSPGKRRRAEQHVHDVLEWLWEAAAGPILNQLGFTRQPADGRWPRMWWAPGGLLGLLPLHAAGYHRRAPGGAEACTVMDRVVSSYTPTVRALRYSREPRPTLEGAPPGSSTLIVAMPQTPNAAPLPHTVAEAHGVREFFPGAIGDATGQSGKDQVLAALAGGCRIAHFACHAVSDPVDPSASRLLLADHQTAPLTVTELAQLRLQHAELAYLSACETALTKARTVLDESIHVASAFHMAGFGQVVATLWPVRDDLAAELAVEVYQQLQDRGGGDVDVTHTALALHHATQRLRGLHLHHPSRWAAYIHTGV